eukprot:gene4828-21750_t
MTAFGVVALLYGNAENTSGVRELTTGALISLSLMPTTVALSLVFKRAQPPPPPRRD